MREFLIKNNANILKCDCLFFQHIHTVILPEFLTISATVLRTLNYCFENLWENTGNQNSIHSSITFGQLQVLLKGVFSHFV